MAYTLKCQVMPLDTATALLTADLHRQHKLATADAIVYATAVQQRAELLTCDAHFEGLPGVVLFPKSQAHGPCAFTAEPANAPHWPAPPPELRRR